MQTFVLIIHILVCIVLIVSILLQSSKGGGLAGAFGGAGGQTGAMFGGTGAATFLSKVTRWLAVVFFLTCLGLWYTSRSADTLPETASQRVGREQRVPTAPPQQAAPAESAPAGEKPADTGN